MFRKKLFSLFCHKDDEKRFTLQPSNGVHKIEKGYALVIHNRYFHHLRPRRGSEKDLKAIKMFCEEASLKIDVQENLKVNDIRAHCRKLTDEDDQMFKQYDSFVCFILSHGNR